VVVQVNGRNLPGASCGPPPGSLEPYTNVHVSLGPWGAPQGLVRGDAPSATWRVEVRPVELADGTIDLRGPTVSGRRGERCLYLNWGTVDEDGRFHLFRRGKVLLGEIGSHLVREAVEAGAELHCTIDLTDARGNPVCARLRPPAIGWSVVRRP
jgi:hypothetical protein